MNGRQIATIAILTLALVSVSIGLTLTQPFEYRSSFTLLLLEKDGSLDGFAAAKSAERLSTSLSQILYTTSFYDQVLEKYQNAGATEGDLLFSNNESERRQEWKRRVETRVSPEVGILKISVYDRDRAHAEQLASTLALVLVERGTEYLGGGRDVVLKVVDSPLTSTKPARPNIAYNVAIAILISIGISAAWLAIRSLIAPQQPNYSAPKEHIVLPAPRMPENIQPPAIPQEENRLERVMAKPEDSQDGQAQPLGWNMP